MIPFAPKHHRLLYILNYIITNREDSNIFVHMELSDLSLQFGTTRKMCQKLQSALPNNYEAKYGIHYLNYLYSSLK